MRIFRNRFVLFFIWILSGIRMLSAAELDIICTTDLHGHFEQFPALAPLIRSCGSSALKIDVGDTLTGTLLSDKKAGEPMIELLNTLEFDVWVPGNHDFETGYEAFINNMKSFRGAVLGVQWTWRDAVPLKWKLFERNGVRAAVIGASDPMMSNRTLPGTDAVFSDLIFAIKKIMPDIHAAKPDVIILALHNGLYAKLGAPSIIHWYFPEIHLILGGHSHKEIAGYRLRDCYFVQAGCHGECVARVKVRVDDKSRKIRRIESALLYPDPAEIDRKLAALCGKLQNEQKQYAEKNICRVTEKRISGAFLADALRRAAGADGAIVVFGSDNFVRRSVRGKQEKFLPVPESVSEGVLYKIIPFRNRVCVIEVSGDDLAELSETVNWRRKKYKQRFYFAGDIRMDGEGNLKIRKNTVKIALSDYLMCSIPVLQRKLERIPRCWRIVEERFERDVFRNALHGLSAAGKTFEQSHKSSANRRKRKR